MSTSWRGCEQGVCVLAPPELQTTTHTAIASKRRVLLPLLPPLLLPPLLPLLLLPPLLPLLLPPAKKESMQGATRHAPDALQKNTAGSPPVRRPRSARRRRQAHACQARPYLPCPPQGR